MIYLQKASHHPPSLKRTAEALLKQLFHSFLNFLEEEKVKYSALPKQSQSGHASVALTLNVELEGREANVFCRMGVRWPQTQKMLNIWIEFKISRIADVPLANFPNRTRIQLISAIGELNKCLRERYSCLTLSYDGFDSFIFTARSAFLPSQTKGEVKRTALTLIKTSFIEFVKQFREMSKVDFFKSGERLKQNQPLRQILENLYVSKSKVSMKNSQNNQKTIKSCLSILARRTVRHNATFASLQKSNQYKQMVMGAKEEPKKDIIANAIQILKKEKPNADIENRLLDNLQKNQAVKANEEIISLSKVTFQLRRSFGLLRQGKQRQIMHYSNKRRQSQFTYQDHMVLKKCFPSASQPASPPPSKQSGHSQSTAHQSNPRKSQSQSGHQNQHNFLMVNGNLKCPYIGKYYLDVGEGTIDDICKRTIMTRLQRGDLFTQVAYNSHYNYYQFSLIEYLTIFQQLAQAILFLHQNKVIHRDIKPTNVLFQYHSKNRLLCKLIDFGSCFILRESSKHLFNPKVYTTPRFNLTYRQAVKQTGSAICDLFTQNEYQTHELFDIFGIAQTMSFLLESSPHRLPILDIIIGICKNPNPNHRFTPQELLSVIRHIKYGLFGPFVH